MSNISNVSVGISADSSAMQKALEDAKNKTKKFGTKFNETMTSVGKKSVDVAKSVAKIGLAVSAAAIGKTVQTYTAYETEMLKVKAVTSASEEQFAALSDQVKELGATTSFSASQAAEAQRFLGMAGFETNEILKATPSLLSLAAAGSLELGAAADITSNILTGMGLSADQTGRAADVLAKAAASSNTSVEQLGVAMKYGAPVGKEFGLSLEETTTWMSKLSDAGIQAEMAGTGLRRVMLNLVGPSKEAARIMDDIGFDPMGEDGRLRPMQQLMEELKKLKDEGKLTQESMAKIFGKQGFGVAAIMMDASETSDEFTKTLEGSQGAAKKMAEIQQSGIKGAINQLKSASEALFISLGEAGVIEAVTKALVKITDIIRSLTEVMTGNKSFGDFFSEMFGLSGDGTAGDMAGELGKKIGAAIGKFLAETDWIEVGKAIWKGMKAALSFAASLFTEIGKQIWNAIKSKLPAWAGGGEGSSSFNAQDQILNMRNLTGNNRTFTNAKKEVAAYLKQIKEGEKITTEMVNSIIQQLQIMEDNGGKSVKKFADDLTTELQNAANEVVHFSIIPDMVNDVISWMTRMRDEGKRLSKETGDGLVNGLLPGIKKFESFKDVGGFIRDGLNDAARYSKKAFQANKALATAEALISTYQGIAKAWSFGPLLGPVLAGLVAAAGFAQVGAIQAQQYQGLATGGVVTSPGMFRVGERGPENVFLPGGAAVAANGSALGPGGGNTYNINITGNADERAVRMIKKVIIQSESEVGVAAQQYGRRNRSVRR